MSDAEIYLWTAVALYICGFFVMGGLLGLGERRRGGAQDAFFILTWPLIVIAAATAVAIGTIVDAWKSGR